MSSNRIAPIALLSTAGLAALAFLVSAAGGCQILSGISDLEATGGADAGSSTKSSSSSSSTTGMSSSSSSSSSVTSGSAMSCDPAAATNNCVACGTNGTPMAPGPPPYCDGASSGECLINACDNGSELSVCSAVTGPGMPTELDTSVMSMHVVCNGANCDGDTIDCGGHADHADEAHIFGCTVDCPTGTCTDTIVDCTKAYGTCTVNCEGTGCSGLMLKCGKNVCNISCNGGVPNPTASFQPFMNGCNMPKPPQNCAVLGMP